MKISQYEPNSVFILGAGFTKAMHPEAPLNADLLRVLISSGNAPKLLKYHQKYRIDDIEKLLTIIDLESSDNPKTKADRTAINSEISSFFSRYRFSVDKISTHSWLEKLILEVFQPNDAVISLNYDCFLEGALDYYGAWTPNGGYARVQNMLAESISKNRGVLLYKIHGSENFIESSIANNRAQTAISFKIDPTIFPKTGNNKYFGGGAIDPRPFIIAPSLVKIPHVDIAALMLDALENAQRASNLVIIGCGMRLEDNFLWLLLCNFLNYKGSVRKRLVLVSPSAAEIWQRISNYWVGDIRKFADVFVMPYGLESGLEDVINALS